uniref:Centromere protein R n=1 Tax=Salvator merianae TaxID=96440 RepID=A0A8D0DY55_SALMN
MSVKRTLKLDNISTSKGAATPLMSSRKKLRSYSPTTGTCLLSPLPSPWSNNVQEYRNGLSNGNGDKHNGIRSSRRDQPQMEENMKLLLMHSEVEDSLERFMEIRQSLLSLQALEGTRELENIIGVSDSTGNLKSEVRKTRKLLEQAGKQKLLKRKLPAKEHSYVNTFEFLQSLIG